MTPAQGSSPSAGFSLVELLVALALVGVLTGLVAQSFSFGARVWEREVAEGTNLDLTAARLTQILEGAVLPRLRSANFSVRVPFAGSARGMTFLSDAGDAGLERWSLEASRTGDGWSLKGRRTPIAGPDEDTGDAAGIAVFELRGLDGVRFAYATGRGGAGPDWMPVWPSGPHAPRLVRMSFERGRIERVAVAHLRTAR